jgi:hypothetical protein
MPENRVFPHLSWTYTGVFEPSFNSGRKTPDEVRSIREDRTGHGGKIKSQLDSLRHNAHALAEERRAAGLPAIQGKGFLLRVPEGTDVDALAYSLGIELVAETESGLMFAASDDLDLTRLEEVISNFQSGAGGGSYGENVLDVFHEGDDGRKLAELLVGRVRDLWPFFDAIIYTFDLGIQTAGSSKKVEWTRLPPRKRNQTDEERKNYEIQAAAFRLEDRIKAEEVWAETADERFFELQSLIGYYSGEILDGLKHSDLLETRKGIVFPDSIEVRVRMSGKGFRDLIENFRHLFEVTMPPDVRFLPGSPETQGEEGELNILTPDEDAPKVCVIDSGIQEEHRWLEPAIDKASSLCFLPESEPDDVADHFPPRGHGTRVAGAVLYPREVPKEGEIQPIAWIQNARVLDERNHLPITLPPERYLTDVVAHFGSGEQGTKIFNHSISDSKPCEGKRMCSWAAKIDDLVHRFDLLFIQIVGNIGTGEIFDSLSGGGNHPSQLFDDSSKVASPGQSLHALTVGSISHAVVNGPLRQSFARHIDFPSVFTRSGYSPLWNVVKPEVVEYGGDRLFENPLSRIMPTTSESAPELIANTLYGAPAISADDVGTSFTAPKVAHIAAHIQRLFPDASSQLYRALIVQSARWPAWADNGVKADEVLRLIGYGVPSLDRATTNDLHRVTLVTEEATEIWSKQYHLYQISIPEEIRRASLEVPIRIDVTLAYTACPRRTRSRRTGYLETWLDWRSICIGEPLNHFNDRMQGKGSRNYTGIPWTIHQSVQYGDVEVNRNQGSVQKDWAVVEANQLPEDFAIAVRAHVGWNHKEGGGLARYCLAVSFEALDSQLPIYSAIEASVRAEARTEVETEISLF